MKNLPSYSKAPFFYLFISFFLAAGLCLLGCEEPSPAKKQTYKVSFDLNGGEGDIPSQVIIVGGKVTKPEDPTREGYAFGGWYVVGALTVFDFAKSVEVDFVLQARWLAKETDLSLSYNGEAVMPNQNNFVIIVAPNVDIAGLLLSFEVASGAQLFEDNTAIALSNNTVTKEFDFSGSKTKTFKVLAEDQQTESSYKVRIILQTVSSKEIVDFFFSSSENSGLDADVVATIDENTVNVVFPLGTVLTSLVPTVLHSGAFISPQGSVAQDFSNPVTYSLTAQNGGTKTYTVKAWLLQADEVLYKVRFITPANASPVNSQYVVGGKMVATRPSEEPRMDNHQFAGWYTSAIFRGPQYDFTKLVTSDLTLYSRWTANSYAVTLDNNRELSYATVNSGDTMVKPPDPTLTGYLFGGWYTTPNFAGFKYDFGTILDSDLTLYAKWDANYYTVTFDKNKGEGDEFSYATVNSGDTVIKPIDPTLTGYLFNGWYTTPDFTGLKYDFGTILDSDLTLYAKWGMITYRVTFEENGGSLVNDTTVNRGDVVSQPSEPTTTEEGYKFAGWYTTSDFTGSTYNFSTPVGGFLTLYAKWSLNSYTVTFEENGGSFLNDATVSHGDLVSRPTPGPTRNGYRLEDWYASEDLSGLPYDFNSPVNADTTLYAKWIRQYTVTFDTDNKAPAIDAVEVDSARKVSSPTNLTPNAGYTFDGNWYTDESKTTAYNFNELVVSNTTLYAGLDVITYRVTFEENNGSLVNDTTVNHGDVVSMPTNPSRSGFGFSNWYISEDLSGSFYDFSTPVTGVLTLYAKWDADRYTVFFEQNGGSGVDNSNVTVIYGSTVSEPTTNPTRNGYRFLDWYASEDLSGLPYDFNSPVNSDTTLYAKWIRQYTVTFDTDNKAPAISAVVVDSSTSVTRPAANPAPNAGYTFDGNWYTDVSKTTVYNFNEPVISNTTLYAGLDVITYRVTFEENSGSLVNDTTVNHGDMVSMPTNPSRSGFGFSNWYISEDLSGSSYDFSTPVTGVLTLYAKWDEDRYTVYFEQNGGSGVDNNNVTVTYGSTVSEPTTNPTRNGYRFVDWYASEDLSGSPYDFSSPVGSDITLYANWIRRYTVTFDTDNKAPAINAVVVDSAASVNRPGNPTPNAGYTFDGNWYTDESKTTAYAFTEPVISNTTLYAGLGVITYRVTFEESNGSLVSDTTVNHGDAVSQPPEPAPTVDGYKFDGWYTSLEFTGSTYDFSTQVTGILKLYAKRVLIRYTVTFEENGGSLVNDITVNYGGAVSEPDTPLRTNYRFDGLYTSSSFTGTTYDFSTVLNNDMTLYAKWIPRYTVNLFYNEDGIPFPSADMGLVPLVVDSLSKINRPESYFDRLYAILNDPRLADIIDVETIRTDLENNRTHTSNNLWYASSAKTTFFNFDEGKIISDTTIYLQWIRQYKVTFDTDDKALAINAVAVDSATSVTRPANPIPNVGYTFDGNWYTDVSKTIVYDFNGLVSSDITLYAGLERFYTVNFNSNGGTSLDSKMVKEGDRVLRPVHPSKADYVFDGWFTSNDYLTEYLFSTAVNSDITLYARWILLAKTLEGVSSLQSPKVPSDIETYSKRLQDVLKPYTAEASLVFRFLKVNASGTGDATSWDNAGAGDGAGLKNTIDAITDASATKVYVILLAGGTYQPSEELSMKNNVAIVGGFSSAVNWAYTTSDTTILDGNDDKRLFNNSNLDNTALLYGVKIWRGGNVGFLAGGMSNSWSSPILTNVIFSGNTATSGGGMVNFASGDLAASPILTNVTFSGNTATDDGGGMSNYGPLSVPILTNVTFSGNTAAANGGGMYNENAVPILTNVAFSENSATLGGGMANNNASPSLTDVTFSENSATLGGGMANNNSSPSLTDVTFYGNSATRGGGMINENGSSPILTNITFSANRASEGYGGGMSNWESSSPILTNVTFFENSSAGMYNNASSPALTSVTFSSNTNTAANGGGMRNYNLSSPVIVNSIFWGNTSSSASQIYQSSSTVSIHNSILQGDTTAIALENSSTFNVSSLVTTDPFGSNTLAYNGGNVQTIALPATSVAKNIGLYVRRSGSTLYYSTDNATWYTAFTHKVGLSGTTVALPSDAVDFTATDATGYTRVGRPDAGAYEAR